jgi:hypothetical protein
MSNSNGIFLTPPPSNSEFRPDPVLRPAAAAVYDSVTEGLNDRPQHLPTESNSQLNRRDLQIVENILFGGMNYRACIPGYNSDGGRAGVGSV